MLDKEERLVCPNPKCGVEFVIVSKSTAEKQDLRCACGTRLKKTYNRPKLTVHGGWADIVQRDVDSGTEMEPRSNRRAVRHPAFVDVRVIDLELGIQVGARTKDINLYGCGVSTATPFPAGTHVALTMVYGPDTITALGNVIYGRPDIGMGIVFTTVEPRGQRIIEDWIAKLAVSK